MTRLEKIIKVLKSLGFSFESNGHFVVAFEGKTARFELFPNDEWICGGAPDTIARNVEAYNKFKAAFDSWVEPLPDGWKLRDRIYDNASLTGPDLAWHSERPKAHRDTMRKLFDYLDKQEANK